MGNKTTGQFFSGPLVANLLVSLVSLVGRESIASAIDPMVGKGDMLVALKEAGVDDSSLYGIDIDADALAMAKEAIPLASFVKNDAFSTDLSSFYASNEWDLVITNPPYVRYQTLNKMYGDGAVDKVRHSLISLLQALPERDDKSMYLEAAESYSGLSDLAVPAWILCAYLVKPGGTLAMVVPGSWLTREYASIIRTLLTRSFELKFVVEDESRDWFPEAQVKTNLLVAKKTESSLTQLNTQTFRHIGLTNRVSSTTSLIENIKFSSLYGKEAFEKLCSVDDSVVNELYWARTETQASIGVASESVVSVATNRAPTLADWEVKVGQGLRTGANSFFYLIANSFGELHNEVLDSSGQKLLALPLSSVLLPALRYQHDLKGSYAISSKDVCNRLLYIRRPLDSLRGVIDHTALVSLESYIKHAEGTPFRIGGHSRLIPSLSAVRTNGPASDIVDSESYWYMLPRLQSRHLPTLLMPRVNGGSPKSTLVSEPGDLVVDANFLTFCLKDVSDRYSRAVLALLNSTMVKLALENLCCVLGGGALKCDASAVKKISLPFRDDSLVNDLGNLGAQLLEVANGRDETEIINKIDLVIGARTFLGNDVEELQDLVECQQAELQYRLTMRG